MLVIVKELDTDTRTTRRRAAGYAAEAQLAFYLQRTFVDRADIHVFNGLRFESGGDAAQLDHVILHPHGLIIVESKSVYAKVKINERNEWLRLYKGHYQGMPSPKLQADRQIIFLRRYLEGLAQDLGPLHDKRSSFTAMPVDLLVAVSDGAVIDRPVGDTHDYLIKAESVPERIESLVATRRPSGGLFGRFKERFTLTPAEMSGFGTFFSVHHRPLEQPWSSPDIVSIPPPPTLEARTPVAESPRCKHCDSGKLEVRSGRYGYFFGCLACNKSTTIFRSCSRCENKEKVRKQGATFYGECAPCNRSVRFFVNG